MRTLTRATKKCNVWKLSRRSVTDRSPLSGIDHPRATLACNRIGAVDALRGRDVCVVDPACQAVTQDVSRRHQRIEIQVLVDVKVSASVVRSFTNRRMDEPEKHVSRLAALQAHEIAGLCPKDMDVAEVHDASAMGEILQSENRGLVPLGGGGPAAERGEFTLGWRLPVNPSGGLESNGHPLGATGIGQLYELVTQLRGEAGARQVQGARHAIQENGGGMQGVEEAAVAIHILSR